MLIGRRRNWAGLIFMLMFIAVMTGRDIARGNDLSDEDGMIENIIEAVRHAQRPCNNIRVEWTWELPGGSRNTLKANLGRKQNASGTWKYSYNSVLSGIRSRVDILAECYHEGSDSPSTAFDELRVFNGMTFKSLQTYTAGPAKRRPVGIINTKNQNSPLWRQRLFHNRDEFNFKELREKYKLGLRAGKEENVYILDLVNEFGGRRQVTIDGNRGFNVKKVERIRPNGTTDYEINYQIKEYDGQWFQGGYEFLRHPRPGTTGSPKVDRKVTVKKVEFNIDVPEETFDLDFPAGTEVRDLILNISYTIGAPDAPILEGALEIESTIEDTDKPDNNAASGETDHTANHEVEDAAPLSQSHENHLSGPANNNAGFVLLLVLGVGVLVYIFFRVKTRKRKLRCDTCV